MIFLSGGELKDYLVALQEHLSATRRLCRVRFAQWYHLCVTIDVRVETPQFKNKTGSVSRLSHEEVKMYSRLPEIQAHMCFQAWPQEGVKDTSVDPTPCIPQAKMLSAV